MFVFRKLLVVLTLTMIMMNYISASNKAVFVHGFGSNSDTWLEKNTPQ